jgi:hypothetical protein
MRRGSGRALLGALCWLLALYALAFVLGLVEIWAFTRT